MSDTTITVREDTKDRAADMKRQGETWDEFIARLLDAEEYGSNGANDLEGVGDVDVEQAVENAIDASLGDMRDEIAEETTERVVNRMTAEFR
jgi:predicted CopG family antitoxin